MTPANSCPKCGAILPPDAPAGLCPACLMSGGLPSKGSLPDPMRWQPPTVEELQALLPQYEVTRMLGRGGMGAVYQGRQISVDRPVAIKILSTALVEDDQSFAMRFKNEARAMGKLNHPGIVVVYDFGETTDGLLYIVMEYVEGTDVQKMISSQKRLHTSHAMAIAAHVCDALAYAHERGVIHRDIKPANIMVGYDGLVKVADFGLAKVSSGGQTLGMTMTGMAMGTMHYMAPETLQMGLNVDNRADIYAVGVMLYQMLTGKLPRGMFELPSLQIGGLDPRYDGIIAKALREDRDIRYQNAADMRADLDALLTQPVVKVASEKPAAALPSQARPQRPGHAPFSPPRPQGVTAPPKRRPLPWMPAVLLVLGGAAAYFYFAGTSTMSGSGTSVAEKNAEPKEARPQQEPAPAKAPASQPVAATTTAQPPRLPPAKPVTVIPQPKMMNPPTQTPAPEKPSVPELATLQEQYAKLQAERVTQVFEADVAKLDGSYLGGLDRALDQRRAAGQLDDVLLLEQEKKRVTEKRPMPETDDDQLRSTVKNLRAIYREAYAKLQTTRGTNLAVLTKPLFARLKVLESDLTKQNRISDAKMVREYRETLAVPESGVTPGADGVYVNTLGMKFVPVPGTQVLFCTTLTRMGDYDRFATETGLQPVGTLGAGETRDMKLFPMSALSWKTAKDFCNWLSKKEGLTYRLPTDHEWSIAVGIGDQEAKDATPEALDGKLANVYPWGTRWPPPDNFANYCDESYKAFVKKIKSKITYHIIDGYHDGELAIAPVSAYRPNRLGLYDMGGNLRQWCEDWYDAAQTKKVLRGACWGDSESADLLSSKRWANAPSFEETNSNSNGFRCVLEIAKPAAVTASTSGFTNTLGMKFVPVPGTEILMCIHETRRKDYATYALSNLDVNADWKTPKMCGKPIRLDENHPVYPLSQDDAHAFCAWLSKREGKTYRLPTDREWSLAVGIGDQETAGASPESLNRGIKDVYPWGTEWPPPKGAGNYWDLTAVKEFHPKKTDPVPFNLDPNYLDGFGYTDGFVGSSPVMSFPPNKLGIYDLGGNAYEVCEDAFSPTNSEVVFRGASFDFNGRNLMLSSSRVHQPKNIRAGGFRCVVEAANVGGASSVGDKAAAVK